MQARTFLQLAFTDILQSCKCHYCRSPQSVGSLIHFTISYMIVLILHYSKCLLCEAWIPGNLLVFFSVQVILPLGARFQHSSFAIFQVFSCPVNPVRAMGINSVNDLSDATAAVWQVVLSIHSSLPQFSMHSVGFCKAACRVIGKAKRNGNFYRIIISFNIYHQKSRKITLKIAHYYIFLEFCKRQQIQHNFKWCLSLNN